MEMIEVHVYKKWNGTPLTLPTMINLKEIRFFTKAYCKDLELLISGNLPNGSICLRDNSFHFVAETYEQLKSLIQKD